MIIKNEKEKILVMACYKCNSNRNFYHIFSKSGIYQSWINRWSEDFIADGRHPHIFKNKFVLSVDKAQKGFPQPDNYKEWQKFLNDVTDWIISHYDKKLKRKHNFNNYKKQLMQYREECLRELQEKCKEVFGDKCEILVVKNKFNMLAIYMIQNANGNIAFQGTYEDTLYFIKSIEAIQEE